MQSPRFTDRKRALIREATYQRLLWITQIRPWLPGPVLVMLYHDSSGSDYSPPNKWRAFLSICNSTAALVWPWGHVTPGAPRAAVGVPGAIVRGHSYHALPYQCWIVKETETRCLSHLTSLSVTELRRALWIARDVRSYSSKPHIIKANSEW